MKKTIVCSVFLSLFSVCLAMAGKPGGYGIVNLSVANLHVEADFSSSMATQALLGMPVRILQDERWFLVQTPDGYVAWVHHAGVHPVSQEELHRWNAARKVVVTDLYGLVYSCPDTRSQTVSDIVAGNRLLWVDTSGDFYRVAYPDGRKGYVLRSAAVPEKEWRAGLRRDADAVISTAFTFMGIPYLWGGISSKGMDCSGFVRSVLFMHDVIIPRDASQQARVGCRMDIAPDFSNLQPGDLLFFGSKGSSGGPEKIVHVGIYLGDRCFIHSQGDVHVSSFNVQDERYDEFNLKRLLFATRILPYVNRASEITTTDRNSYYSYD